MQRDYQQRNVSRHVNFLTAAIMTAIGAAFAPSAHAAAVVVGWDFDPITGVAASPYAPAQAASELTVVGLTRGSGVNPSGITDGWGGTNFLTTDAAGAEAAGDYFTFSLTSDASTSLSLSSIDAYTVRRTNPLGPPSGRWQYDVGSGFVNLGGVISNWGAAASAGNPQSAIDLSGISALQDIAPNNTVTFRLLLWGGQLSTGSFYLFDPPTASNDIDFSLQGTLVAAITPEPAGLSLLAIAGAGLIRRRRR